MSASKLLNQARNAIGDLAVAASAQANDARARDDIRAARRLNARAWRLSAIAGELIDIERRVIEELT